MHRGVCNRKPTRSAMGEMGNPMDCGEDSTPVAFLHQLRIALLILGHLAAKIDTHAIIIH
jgi:hypothetical protein